MFEILDIIYVGTQKVKAQAHLEQWYLAPQIKPKQ